MSYSKQKVVARRGDLRSTNYRKNGQINSLAINPLSFSFTASADYGEFPGWRAAIKQGLSATTQLSGVDLIVHEWIPGNYVVVNPTATGFADYRHISTGMLVSGHQLIPSAPGGLSTTSADNRAKTAFLKKLIRYQTAFTGGVFLGELRKTLQMLRRPAKALRDGFDSYYSTAKRRTRRVSRTDRKNAIVSNTWLEYSYGWVPLISDIENACDAISRRNSKILRPIMDWGADESASAGTTVTTVGHLCVLENWKSRSTVHVKYQGCVDCTASNPVSLKAGLFGFRPEEFLPTIWELIPYSFLVDYFTNIGEIINGWSYQRSGLAWSLRTIRQSKFEELMTAPNLKAIQLQGFGLTSFGASSSILERKQISRTNYTGNFIPSIEFSIPGLRGRDALKWLNISALARIRSLR